MPVRCPGCSISSHTIFRHLEITPYPLYPLCSLELRPSHPHGASTCCVRSANWECLSPMAYGEYRPSRSHTERAGIHEVEPSFHRDPQYDSTIVLLLANACLVSVEQQPPACVPLFVCPSIMLSSGKLQLDSIFHLHFSNAISHTVRVSEFCTMVTCPP